MENKFEFQMNKKLNIEELLCYMQNWFNWIQVKYKLHFVNF